MRVMSFNILCGGQKENWWKKRTGRVVEIIKKYAPDTFGLQEAHYRWMNVVCKALPEYDYVGVGRDNGKRLGEFSPVFYLKDKFEVVDKGNFWLSETPEVPGKGWDAACIRICSYAVLREKQTGKTFAHFNTHLDHVGPTAQIEGARIIADRGLKYPDMPTVVTGDFNVVPDSQPYKTIIASGFKDTRDIAKISDDFHTFHNFDRLHQGKLSRDIIDYVFVRNIDEVVSFKTVTDKVEGMFPSDHYPVIAEFDI